MNKNLKTKIVIASSAALVTFIVYLPALQNKFVNWDDDSYVYNNSFIRSLDAQLLKAAFTEFHLANRHPLTWFSHALDYAIWGLNPLGHHLTNNIFHALNTFIVVFLIMRLMEVFRENNGPSRPFLENRTIRITGLATGLLFGLHPLHVESVAWVAERKDLLCAFFFLLTILTYTYYVSELDTRASDNYAARFFNKKYLFTIGFFVLSVLSKPMAVTLPIVLLILDWYLFRRIQNLKAFWTTLIEKLPFLALTLISSILTILAQKSGGAINSIEDLPLSSRVIVAAKSLIAYLLKIILPINLVPYYPYPQRVSLLSLEYIIPILIAAVISLTCIAVMQKQKLYMAVWSYYVVTLMPVLGIVQTGGQSMADRYAYLPSVGPFFIIALLSAKVFEGLAVIKRRGLILKTASYFSALMMLAFLIYVTKEQIGIWRNSFIFWNYVIEKEPGRVPHAHYNLGNEYSSKGLFDMAIEQYRIALRLKPDYIGAYNNLGNIYSFKGQLDMAIEQYRIALSLQPAYADGHYNLGCTYLDKGLLDLAIEQYRIALSLKPDYANAHYNLGKCYLNKGFKDMARKEFELELTINPDNNAAQQILKSLSSR